MFATFVGFLRPGSNVKLGSTSGNHLLLRVKQGGRVVWNPKSLPKIKIVTVIFTQNRNLDSNTRGREGAFHEGLP